MGREEKIQELNRIYAAVKGGVEASSRDAQEEKIRLCPCLRNSDGVLNSGREKDTVFVRRCLYDEDYLVRTRSFALVERCSELAMGKILLHIVFGEEEREWQLRALAALEKQGTAKEILALKSLLFQEKYPLLIRGALWVFVSNGQLRGEPLLGILREFLLSPYCAYLKTAFVADALALGIRGEEECWAKMCKENSPLAEKAAFYRRYVKENTLLQVYPYPDYLSKAALAQDISVKELKQALFFKRQKA